MWVELKSDGNMGRYANALRAMGEMRARKVLSDALNKAGDKGRTQVKRSLAQTTGIKYGQIGMRTIRSTPGTLQYTLEQPGDETNLNKFAARQGARGVSARPWGIRRVFPGTFIVQGWGSKVYSRAAGASRFPISQLWGPNLAREVVKDEPAERFQDIVKDLQPQVENQIRRMIMHSFGF